LVDPEMQTECGLRFFSIFADFFDFCARHGLSLCALHKRRQYLMHRYFSKITMQSALTYVMRNA
jgi:hypothetical protein